MLLLLLLLWITTKTQNFILQFYSYIILLALFSFSIFFFFHSFLSHSYCVDFTITSFLYLSWQLCSIVNWDTATWEQNNDKTDGIICLLNISLLLLCTLAQQIFSAIFRSSAHYIYHIDAGFSLYPFSFNLLLRTMLLVSFVRFGIFVVVFFRLLCTRARVMRMERFKTHEKYNIFCNNSGKPIMMWAFYIWCIVG